MSYLVILIGGGIGAVTRYIMSKIINNSSNTIFPIGTMIVNMVGCLLIGFLFGLIEKIVINSNLRLFIFVGFLGGFTTFSSFGLETINLIRDGKLGYGIANIILSNIVGLILVYVGLILSRFIVK